MTVTGLALTLVAALAAQGEEAAYAPVVHAASDEGLEAMAAIVAADGVELDLVAAEPLVANPVCLYVCDDGSILVSETFRLHHGVTDMREHPDWLDRELANETVADRVAMFRDLDPENFDTYDEGEERLRRLVDRDGDGVMDEAIVFADGFTDPAAGIAASVLAHGEDVYYTCIPEVWRLRDVDGDGQAEEREVLSTGYGVHVALLGHDLHGLRVGPDGKLYFSCGDRGFLVETPGGVLDNTHTGAVLRCNLDGSELEIFATGLRNPQDLVFDAYGNLFTGDNNSDGGDRARWIYVVEGGDTGWRFEYQYIESPTSRGPWNEERLWVPHFPGQAAWIVPPIANLADGPSGLTWYPGTGLDSSYADHFFLCDFRGGASYSGVHSFAVVPQGAGFTLGPVDRFLWGTLVTDIDFGPDSALYFSDWVSGWNMTGKGRVYRARRFDAAGDAAVAEVAQRLAAGFTELDGGSLATLLSHADRRLRQGAQFELVGRGEQGRAILHGATKVDNLFARMHGVWGLGMVGRTERSVLPALRAALHDPHDEVRAQAARVLGDLRDAQAADYLVAHLRVDTARVAHLAAIALGKIGAEMAWKPLAKKLGEVDDSDAVLRHSLVMGLAGCASPEQLVGLLDARERGTRMGAVLALRRLRRPEIAEALADSDPLISLEAARAIHDLPLNAAAEQLAAMLERRVVAVEEQRGRPVRVRAEFWNNLTDGTLAGLRALPGFPQAPDMLADLDRFSLGPNHGDHYGAHLVAEIEVPLAGEYVFWACADDEAEVRLRHSGAPDLEVVAVVPSWTAKRSWTVHEGQHSRPIELKAGEIITVDVLHAEGGGGDHLSVGWTLPDGSFEAPIGDPPSAPPTSVETFDGGRALERRLLNQNLRLGGAVHAGRVADYAATPGRPAELRAEALAYLGFWGDPPDRDRVQGAWRPLAERDASFIPELVAAIGRRGIGDAPAEVVDAWCALVGSCGALESQTILRAWVKSRARPQSTALAALSALEQLADEGFTEDLKRALMDDREVLRAAALAALGRHDRARALPLLADVLQRGGPEERRAAFGLLATAEDAGTAELLRGQLAALEAGLVAGELALDLVRAGEARGMRELPERGAAGADLGAYYALSLAGGELTQGRKIFMENAALACRRCHTADDGGAQRVGPDLAGVGTRLTPEQLLEAVISPNASVVDGYDSVVLSMDDGSYMSGRVLEEDAETVVLLDAEGDVFDLAVEEITGRSVGLSAMPDGHAEHLNRRAMRDLIAYLKSL